jgi:hypothetical protein
MSVTENGGIINKYRLDSNLVYSENESIHIKEQYSRR